MVSHGVYPKLDASGAPGTLSAVISRQLLRETIGYDGLAITDDMEMHAVSDLATPEEIAVRSLLAGNDLILFCSRIEELPSIATHIDVLTSRDELVAARFEEATKHCERFVSECARIQAGKQFPRAAYDEIIESVRVLNARTSSGT